jgi:hypothetical protein
MGRDAANMLKADVGTFSVRVTSWAVKETNPAARLVTDKDAAKAGFDDTFVISADQARSPIDDLAGLGLFDRPQPAPPAEPLGPGGTWM